MSKRILIKNARLLDPSQGLDKVANVLIVDQQIASISAPGEPTGNDAQCINPDITIEGKDQILSPGFIDLNTHLGEPGYEQKGTIASETKAAAASGFTRLVCSPDTLPVVDSPAIASMIQDKAKEAGFSEVHPLGALTKHLKGEQLSEMFALKEAGCIAVSNGQKPVKNRTLLRALEYAATHQLTVLLHPEDQELRDKGSVHEGYTATRLGLRGIPEAAETVALTRDLLLVKRAGVKAHFVNISCATSVELIASAQQKGLPVTAGTSIQHLHLTDESIEGYNAQCHVLPPFRTENDLLALRQGVAQGVINVICSGHRPHDAAAKLAPFAVTEPGISALDSFLPLCLFLVEHEVLSLAQLITAISHGPAQVIGHCLDQIKVGAKANLCLFDPHHVWSLTAENMLSRGHNTPFLGQSIKGKVTATLLNGNLIFSAPPKG